MKLGDLLGDGVAELERAVKFKPKQPRRRAAEVRRAGAAGQIKLRGKLIVYKQEEE